MHCVPLLTGHQLTLSENQRQGHEHNGRHDHEATRQGMTPNAFERPIQ